MTEDELQEVFRRVESTQQFVGAAQALRDAAQERRDKLSQSAPNAYESWTVYEALKVVRVAASEAVVRTDEDVATALKAYKEAKRVLTNTIPSCAWFKFGTKAIGWTAYDWGGLQYDVHFTAWSDDLPPLRPSVPRD